LAAYLLRAQRVKVPSGVHMGLGAKLMELINFRITNFRSINDSGDVTVSKLTSLVGRNESGKSNLLLGLATLNPSGGRKPLNKIKDFPRGRRLEECNDGTPVVASRWKLSAAETNAIGKTLGGYSGAITEVEIGREYGPLTPRVDLVVIRPTVTRDEVESIFRRLGPVLTARIAALDDPHKANSGAAWKALEDTVSKIGFPKAGSRGRDSGGRIAHPARRRSNHARRRPRQIAGGVGEQGKTDRRL
jgi:hypothetical protein